MKDSVSATGVLQFCSYLSAEDQKIIHKAVEYAIKWHKGQRRQSGEPYVIHPIAVATYLTQLQAGRDTLVAALLHDVVEDEGATLQEVEEEFGPKVAELVDGVTKLSKLEYEGQRDKRQVASLRKMLLSAHDDLRVIFIKLADRWHNANTLTSLPEEKKQRIAKETLEIYVPFARLVGLWSLKSEFEKICFPIVYPKEYTKWTEALNVQRKKLRKERENFVQVIDEQTADSVQAEIDEMTTYEIYTNLQGNFKRIEDSRNIDSVLVHAGDENDSSEEAALLCYKILGEVHRQYPILTGSFRDYISLPQPNGYKALHTTIFLSQNHLVRLRIQTRFMYEHANKRRMLDWVLDPDGNTKSALSVLKMARDDSEQYMQALQSTVLERRINLFTASGGVMVLPAGSTGVDFALAVNPDHIRYLESIRVNGHSAEATKTLTDGDTVELVLANEKSGNAFKHLWLNKAKSYSAQQRIRTSLKHTKIELRDEQAKAVIEQELQKHKLSSKVLFNVKSLQKKIASILGKNSFDEVLQLTANGMLPVSAIVDAYKKSLIGSNNFGIHLLIWLGLLPRSRVLRDESKIIDIEIYADDRPGLIHDVTRCFADRMINIARFSVYALPNTGALYKIRLEVKDFNEFSDVYDALHQVQSVQKIVRKK